MIDLHTHSLLSDGVLLPAELVRRAEIIGYAAIGITDHVDLSNIDSVIQKLLKFAEGATAESAIRLIPGVEITHVPLSEFKGLVAFAREKGIKLIVGHGETIVEPVRKGTNRAAIEAGVNILAHPGLITLEDAKLAAEKGVFLEISGRKGHCLSNGHVVQQAIKSGAKLILDTDAHLPEDLISFETAQAVVRGAGLESKESLEVLQNNPKELLSRLGF
ncbi:MAG: histidinol phosphate phosphatase domain-containing protein [Candidatus Omnitrophica bacterium]|nr:histidinol phosphate phosphatase domain-containing protein [Candidatus Omnitrophota bacterium]MBU1925943.1 histidinol phosphate phosphatase domain-containing protein [Candidatus Omnitrophota bacterium]MBU2063142.1 histidinol phosphate phosphatase domain-containing protein [Candidatus Omnitrophota bacterium]